VAVLVLPVLALFASAPQAEAVTFTVDSLKDGVDANVADEVCATAKGRCTLRAAIDEANDEAGDDEIKLPKGTIELKRAPGPGGGVDNAEGDLDLTETVEIDGRGRKKTVIEQTVADRVLRNVAPFILTDPVEVSDLALTGGRIGGAGENGGAGFQNDDGFAILENILVRGNVARSDEFDEVPGGGVWTNRTLGLVHSTVRGNVSRGEGATMAQGGGVWVHDGGATIQDGSRIVGNEAELRNRDGNYQAEAGGLMVQNPGGNPEDSVLIFDSTIAGNTALQGLAAKGGGIEVAPGAELSLSATTISGNRSKLGGGLAAIGSTVSADNSTFSGNSDTGDGGAAIYAQVDSGDFDLMRSTVASNHPSAGRASIEAQQAGPNALTLTGSIVSGPGTDCDMPAGSLVSAGRSVLGDASCPLNGLANDAMASPRLRSLDDYGGPTETHALRASSPAIDRVTNCSPGVDQRGVSRPQGDFCDSGSFEKKLPLP
jgi:hypothetical protein